MPKWCVESYPSSLYKFEKTRFWHFVTISGRGQGGPNPCLLRKGYNPVLGRPVDNLNS